MLGGMGVTYESSASKSVIPSWLLQSCSVCGSMIPTRTSAQSSSPFVNQILEPPSYVQHHQRVKSMQQLVLNRSHKKYDPPASHSS